VWVGNNRGTKYSQHERDRKGYWDFSFDQLVKYDVPALLSSILRESGANKLIYIGHSQGSTQFKAALLEYP
jgi:lysosomal acid lipase/cholesteryl ester hydrolase